jgi:hypothetical protein
VNAWVTYDDMYENSLKKDIFKKWLEVPAEVPIFADGIWTAAWPRANDLPPSDLDGQLTNRTAELSQNNMRRICIDRHRRKVNVVFKSLHTEAVELERLWQLQWHKNYQRSETQIELPSR